MNIAQNDGSQPKDNVGNDLKSAPPSFTTYYTLAILFLIYVVNFVDRQILSILLEPIKEDLNLSDSQLGLLTGLAFALFYATCGIPIAYAADRFSRTKIVAFALTTWSVMTALCGLANNFWQMMALRVGVAVGEAGSGPPSHSMIADLFPRQKRGTAMALYACGVPIGTLIALALGGWLNEQFNWRVSFFLVGLPGILLAIILVTTVREPKREITHSIETNASMWQTFKTLWKIASYRDLTIATALHSFVGFGILVWLPAFFIRTFDLGTSKVGLSLGLILGISSAIGTYLGGYLADWLGAKHEKWYAWLPAFQQFISVPFYIAMFFAPDYQTALLYLIIPGLLSNAYTGPVFATVQSLAPVQMRATAAALLLFIFALVGHGGGPLAIGILSDVYENAFGAASLSIALTTVLLVYLVSSWRFIVAGNKLKADLKNAEMQLDGPAS